MLSNARTCAHAATQKLCLTLESNTEGEKPGHGAQPLQNTRSNPAEPRNEAPVIVAGKDQGEVDNDYFLLPAKILDHEGPLRTGFPIENRLLAQGACACLGQPTHPFPQESSLTVGCCLQDVQRACVP